MKAQDESNLAKAQAAWGSAIPDYITVLALRCDETTQRAVGKIIGLGSASISKLIARKYGAGYAELENKIRSTLMNTPVQCPAFGEIPLASCLINRRPTRAPVDIMERTFAAACPNCPLNSDIKKKGTSHATV